MYTHPCASLGCVQVHAFDKKSEWTRCQLHVLMNIQQQLPVPREKLWLYQILIDLM